ncbi:MAG: propionyl-CoA synthetase [Proteobacteria bacterium]|nr:propionyl-CoA synthetase [Pseudomonadota bacterium]
MTYAAMYQQSLADPKSFWEARAAEIPWFQAPTKICEQDANGVWRWFVDGVTNSCWLALDRHVDEGRGDQIALIYDSPATGQVHKYTYAELTTWTAQVAGGLVRLGVGKGDRVIIYMPMVPEAVIGMLACARIGAIHSVVFGGFAAPELASRIDDSRPAAILSATCGIEFDKVIPYVPLLKEAVSLASHKPVHKIVLNRPECRVDLKAEGLTDWLEFEEDAQPAPCEPVLATDPLYMLYTSGTTGKPKGVIRDNGGHAVALAWSMRAIYGCDPGDVYWAASDVGWVVGHSYIVYGPLFGGCTTILFEGKPVRTPDAGTFWRVVQDHKVKSFFVAPTAFRAIIKEDPECKLKSSYDLSSLKYQFVAGERLDPTTYHWLKTHLGIPVIDHWWQTETGWSICANMAGVELLPTKPGSPTLPMPGYDLRILDDEGRELGANQEGAVVIKDPLPPGAFPTVWGDHERYVEAYWSQFEGFYLTGDGGYRDEDGYVYIMGRTDDVMNVAGHRMSTGELEEVVAGHPAVAECSVVGIFDADKGQVPLGLLLLKDGVNIEEAALERELVAMVRQQIGPFANFKRAVVVKRLPKTRSGKILRQVLRKMIDGQPYVTPSTIDDPGIIDEIADTLRVRGVMC